MPCRSAYKIPYYNFSDSGLCPFYLVLWKLYQAMRGDVFILKGSSSTFGIDSDILLTVITICVRIRFASGGI
jgi:hypothetical protein